MKFQAEFAEALAEADWEIGGDAEAMHAVLEGSESNDIRQTRLRVSLAQVFENLGHVQDFVEGRFFFGATDFHPWQQADLATGGGKGREWVGGVKTAEPAQVGILGGGRHHQHIADGGGGFAGGASHGRRMTEPGSP